VDSTIRRLGIATLKAQIELCRITCTALEREFNQPGLSPDKRIELYHRWDAVVRDRKAALKNLAIFEHDERED
jgi:hypothetical protein